MQINIKMESKQAELELSYIKDIIYETRRSLVENGIGYIFWGIIVVIGISLQYMKLLFKVQLLGGYEWFVIIGFGWLVSIFLSRRKGKSRCDSTFGQQILGALWIASGIGMTLVGFIGSLSKTLPGYGIIPVISVILGIAYFTSGRVYETKWMYFIGIGWWVGAIVLFYWHSIHTLALCGGMMIMFQVIPGIYFYTKWKKEFQSINKEAEQGK